MDHYQFLGIGSASLPELTREAIEGKRAHLSASGAAPAEVAQLDEVGRVLLDRARRRAYDATLQPTTTARPFQATSAAVPAPTEQDTRRGPRLARVQSLTTRQYLVALTLLAYVIVSIALIVAFAQELDLRSRLDAGEFVSITEVDDSDDRVTQLVNLWFIVFAVAVLAFVVWIYRASSNADSLSANDLDYSPRDAVVSYFVPILNLWRPYGIMSEIWQESAGDQSPSQRAKGVWLLRSWWAFWIIGWITGLVRGFSGEDVSIARIYADIGITIVDNAAAAALLLITVAVVRRQTAMLRRLRAVERATVATGGPQGEVVTSAASHRRFVTAGAFGALAVTGIVVAIVVSAVDESASRARPASRTVASTGDASTAATERPETDLADALQHFNAGVTHSEAGRWQDALAEYDAAIERDPNLFLAYVNRAAAHGGLGDHAAALADASRAIELDPTYAAAYVNRAAAFNGGLGDHAAALADASRAIELDPTDAAAYQDRAVAHRLLGDLGAALADANRAIDLDPDHAFAYRTRGAIHCFRGDIGLARDDWDMARSLTDDPAARAALDAEIAAFRSCPP